MMDDEVGSLVEKLKPQFVTKWLKTVCEVRFDVMVMCLLPKPAEFARVRLKLRLIKCKGAASITVDGVYQRPCTLFPPGGRILGQVLHHSDPTEGGPEPNPVSDTI